MKWPGRPSSSRRTAEAEATVGAPVAPGSPPSADPAPLDFRHTDGERLKRGIASQVLAEHRRELRRLSSDLDRLSMSTSRAGLLVEELASGLTHELERVRTASVAWAEGRPPGAAPRPAPARPEDAARETDGTA